MKIDEKTGKRVSPEEAKERKERKKDRKK